MADRVYDMVRAAIVRRELQPGDRVSEASLAKRLEVSKTPVREALLRLSQVGLTEPTGTGRVRVVLPSIEKVREAYELRTALETESARLAARRASDEQLELISGFAESSRAAHERDAADEFRRYDVLFHKAIANVIGSARITAAVLDCIDLIVTLRSRDFLDLGRSLEVANHHIDIGAALCSRDADAAASIMRTHVTEVEAAVMASFRE